MAADEIVPDSVSRWLAYAAYHRIEGTMRVDEYVGWLFDETFMVDDEVVVPTTGQAVFIKIGPTSPARATVVIDENEQPIGLSIDIAGLSGRWMIPLQRCPEDSIDLRDGNSRAGTSEL